MIARPTDSQKIPEAILAEAGIWVARLHSPQRTPQTNADLQQWLRTSAAHAKAFEMTTEVWEEAVNLPKVAYRHGQRRRARHQRVLWSGMAAAVVAAISIGLIWVRSSDTVSTGVGEQRVLVLDDGTKVYMNTDTRLAVNYGAHRRQIDLAAGEALFDVARQPDKPFVVRAGDREVTALGTSFVVRYAPGRTDVTLVDGKVKVASVTKGAEEVRSAAPEMPPDMTLSPGQRLTFGRSQSPQIDTPKLDRLLAWRRGQILFEGMPLAQAVEELNRYSTLKLLLSGRDLESLLIDGVFQAGDSESFGRAMVQTYGLEVLKTPRGLVLAEAGSGIERAR